MVKSFKFKFIITLVLVLLFLNILIPVISLALENVYFDPNYFDDPTYDAVRQVNVGNTTVGGGITKFFGTLLAVLRIGTLGWAIIMAISIATKYLMGNAQNKSQIKTDMPTYLIGAVLLFGASGLLTLIQYFVEDVIK